MYSIKYTYTIDANYYQIFRFFSISVGKTTRFGDVRPGDPFEWTPDGIDPWFILPTSFWLLCSYKFCYVYKCLLHLLHVLTSILYIDLYIKLYIRICTSRGKSTAPNQKLKVAAIAGADHRAYDCIRGCHCTSGFSRNLGRGSRVPWDGSEMYRLMRELKI